MAASDFTNAGINRLAPKTTRYEIADPATPGLRLRVNVDGSKVYYLLYRHDGQRRRFRLGRHGEVTVAAARKLARAQMGKVAGGVDVQEERKQSRVKAERDRAATLGAFLERLYWPHVAAEHKRGDQTRIILTREFSHLFAKGLDEITPLTMAKWRRERLAAGIRPSSLNRARGALSGVLSRAVEWGYLAAHPFGRRQFRKLQEDRAGVVRYLEPDEERRFRRALRARDERYRAERINAIHWHRSRSMTPPNDYTGRFVDYLEPLLLTLRLTGMRPAEAFGLDWKHVDLKRRQITVIGQNAKTAQTRYVPMSGELHGILTDWAAQSTTEGLVFPSPQGGRLKSIMTSWRRIRDEAQLANFRLYDLRHSFASSLVQSGTDLNTVRELLGHTEYKMTLRYAHLAPDNRAAAVAALDRLEVA